MYQADGTRYETMKYNCSTARKTQLSCTQNVTDFEF